MPVWSDFYNNLLGRGSWAGVSDCSYFMKEKTEFQRVCDEPKMHS